MQKSQRCAVANYPTFLLILSLVLLSTIAQADDAVNLQLRFEDGRQCRITANYEHSGNVIILTDIDPEEESEPQSVDKKAKALPLAVKGQLAYFQRTSSPQQAMRYYEVAEANIKLEKGSTAPKLDDTNRYIIARLKPAAGKTIEMASVSNTLVQSELELIQNPADPLTLANLFSKDNIKQGSKWEPNLADLAKFLGVVEISKSNVQIHVKQLDAQTVRLHVAGSVEAAVDDVTTEMEISGIAIVDRAKQLVSSLKLGIQQTRNPGQIAPGFDGTTKIDLRVDTDSETSRLSNAAIGKLTDNRRIRQRLKWEPKTGDFVLTYDPRWKLIAAEHDGAILRFVDQGSLMAQCSIVQLPRRPENKPLKLDVYKKEVGKILAADQNASLVSASQFVTPNGLTALRIVVAGVESDLPINWHYFHVSNQQGHQMTFVFTHEESLVARMNSITTQLVNEFNFQDAPKKVAEAIGDNQSKTP